MIGACVIVARTLTGLYAALGPWADATIVGSGGRCAERKAVMTTATVTTEPKSMLASAWGDRVPTKAELDEAAFAFAGGLEPAEYLAMSLSRLLGPEGPDTFPLTAEQAWHLTDYARGLRGDADLLRATAANIERCVQGLYTEAAVHA